MIARTEAIAVRSAPFSRTSRVVTWLTRDFGRVVTVIKGACRPKSFFLGQIDLAYRCEILFHRRESNGVHNIREVWLADCRGELLRSDWRAAVAADYICWLTAQTTGPAHDSAGLFGRLDEDLAALARGAPPAGVILRYELQLLDAMGLAPNFAFCGDCVLPPGRRRFCRFLIGSGHLSCANSLSGGRPSESSVALSGDLVAALRAMQLSAREGLGPRQTPSSEDPAGPVATGVRRFLGMFICHHLDVTMQARRAAFEWLDLGARRAAGDLRASGDAAGAAQATGGVIPV